MGIFTSLRYILHFNNLHFSEINIFIFHSIKEQNHLHHFCFIQVIYILPWNINAKSSQQPSATGHHFRLMPLKPSALSIIVCLFFFFFFSGSREFTQWHPISNVPLKKLILFIVLFLHSPLPKGGTCVNTRISRFFLPLCI